MVASHILFSLAASRPSPNTWVKCATPQRGKSYLWSEPPGRAQGVGVFQTAILDGLRPPPPFPPWASAASQPPTYTMHVIQLLISNAC